MAKHRGSPQHARRKGCLGLFGALVLAVAGLSAAAPVARAVPAQSAPLTTFKLENTSAGGCMKDFPGTAYQVAACPIASNFHVAATKDWNGLTWTQYEDGSGNYLQYDASLGEIISAPYYNYSSEFFYGPAPLMRSLYDAQQNNNGLYWARKGTVSPYYVYYNSATGDNDWARD